MTTRISFEQELQNLKHKLEEMGSVVENSIDNLIEALPRQDEALWEEIIQNDRNINDMERSIEAMCLSLITKQQPLAKDLRMVSAALKLVSDMERIGDQVVDIAELLLRYRGMDFSYFSAHILGMMGASREMVHESVAACLNRDVEHAKRVIESDDVIDTLFNKVKAEIIEILKGQEKDVDSCIDILMIAKHLEKIGDHAVNIGEWTIFQETGSVHNVRLL